MAEDHSPPEGPDSSAVVEDEGSTTMGSFAHVKHIAVGVDIGSTTVKAVVCDPETLEILWSDYQRHETRQPEMVEEFLVRIGNAFPNVESFRVFMTGSGSGPLCQPTGARFVQEVVFTLTSQYSHALGGAR